VVALWVWGAWGGAGGGGGGGGGGGAPPPSPYVETEISQVSFVQCWKTDFTLSRGFRSVSKKGSKEILVKILPGEN
jgi:hypothetical protein